MTENKNTVMTPEEDYTVSFMPAVHRIGRFTIFVAFFLSIAPFIYLYFIKGYNEISLGTMLAGVAAVAPMLIGGWISEPLTYWPILGSAGIYMSYLAGNVMAMRFPVATAVQKHAEADISTPKGQVATIVGIATSIVINLVILLITVLVGQAILNLLPARVLHAFNYCIVGMIGSMVLMRFAMGKGTMAQNALDSVPYIVCGIAAYLLVNFVISGISSYGALIGVGAAVLVAYFRYKKAREAWEAANPD